MTNIFTHILLHGGDGDWQPHSECEPVTFEPGSEGKIKATEARVMAGQPCFHDDDGLGVSLA